MTFETMIRVVFDAPNQMTANHMATILIESIADASANTNVPVLASAQNPRPMRDHNIGEQIDS